MNIDELNVKFKSKFQRHLDAWQKYEKIDSFYLSNWGTGYEYATVSITNKALYVFEPVWTGDFSYYGQSLFLTDVNRAFSIYIDKNSHILIDQNIQLNRKKAIQDYGVLNSEFESELLSRPIKNKSSIKFAKSLNDEQLINLISCKCIKNRYELENVKFYFENENYYAKVNVEKLNEEEIKLLNLSNTLTKEKPDITFNITPENVFKDFGKPYNYDADIKLLDTLT